MINITFSFALFAQSSWLVAQQILRQNSFSIIFYSELWQRLSILTCTYLSKLNVLKILINEFLLKCWIKFLQQNRKIGLDLDGSKTVLFCVTLKNKIFSPKKFQNGVNSQGKFAESVKNLCTYVLKKGHL